MTENHNPKYNFKKHIINLSHSDNFDTAIKEWIQMPGIYKKQYEGTCKCICQRKIKNFYYIYNKITFKYINVGTGCYNKFNFTIANTKINPFLQDIIIKYAKGEYENIEDLDEYSTNLKLRIAQELTDMYKRWDTDIIKLYKLKDDIIELIEDYNFTCLEDLKKLVIETINVLEKEKVEKEIIKQKLEEERIKKEKIEREEHQKIITEDNKFKKEKYIRFQKEQIRKQKEKIINKDKYRYNYDYKGNLYTYVTKCDEFINTLIHNYETNVYIKSELDKKLFDECYYIKYKQVLKNMIQYGKNWNIDNVGHWGGWGGDLNGDIRIDGCLKLDIYKFLKYYKLINPMNIEKHLKTTFLI